MLADKKQSSRLRAYRYLLRLLPFDFQREYGSGMEEVFSDESAAAEHGKKGPLMSLWWRTISEHLDSLYRDVRLAIRALGKNPGFTVAAITMLAVGIGVNVAVFTVTNAVLFKGFRGVVGNDRIVYIDSRRDGRGCCASYPDFTDWRAEATSFEGMGAVIDQVVTLTDEAGFAERYVGVRITANGFGLLGQRPVIGRDFTLSDEAAGASSVTILTYGLWERRYGKDPGIIGKNIRIDGIPATVIGVMPETVSFPANQDLWLPLSPTADLQNRDDRRLWFVFGRLAPNATVRSARAEMQAIGSRLAAAYPITNQGLIPTVQTFTEFHIGSNAVATYGAMWGAVGFVLLIACANLANLLLSRAVKRSREICVRVALGAGRWQIIRQLLIESVLLSAAGGTIGCWIAEWSVHSYALSNPGYVFSVLDLAMDYRVFAYIVATSIGTGLLFGLAPALRLSKLDVNTALKSGGRGAAGGRHEKHLSTLLVSGEVALAVILLAGAGVMTRSILNISRANIGVETKNVLSTGLLLPHDRYPDAESQISFYDHLQTRLAAIPGIESVSLARSLPTAPALSVRYALDGAPPPNSPDGQQIHPTVSALVIGPSYFRTLGAVLLSGREFSEDDDASGPPVAIVNRRFANDHWPEENPLGKRLQLFDSKGQETWATIVGLAPNIVQNDLFAHQKFDPLIYTPYRQKPMDAMYVIARTRIPPGSLTTSFRREVHAIDPYLAIWGGPLDEVLAQSGSYPLSRRFGILFLIFASIALVLASIGLYAVAAHSASQRTQEIGIRMAIGATTGDIRKLIFVEGMLPLGFGLIVGLAGSFVVNPVLKSQLVQVSPADPLTLLAASAVLVLSASLGCWIPARRATRVDPVIALRHE